MALFLIAASDLTPLVISLPRLAGTINIALCAPTSIRERPDGQAKLLTIIWLSPPCDEARQPMHALTKSRRSLTSESAWWRSIA